MLRRVRVEPITKVVKPRKSKPGENSLSEDELAMVLKYRDVSSAVYAEKFGVSRTTINKVRRNNGYNRKIKVEKPKKVRFKKVRKWRIHPPIPEEDRRYNFRKNSPLTTEQVDKILDGGVFTKLAHEMGVKYQTVRRVYLAKGINIQHGNKNCYNGKK